MMHTLAITGRFLAATLLVAIGLGANGCGDTGSATDPAALGNLSVSPGTLQPPFDPGTTAYTVQLPINISSTTITVSPRIAGDTIRIDNQPTTSQTITLDSPGAEKTANIVVTDTGTGGTSKSYTVQVKRAALNGNNSLGNLTIAPGTLAPPFEAGVERYTVSVDNGIGSVTITPILSDPAASMTVNGQPATSGQARTINLNGGGQATAIPITITAQNGVPKTYEVSVSRGPSNDNNLKRLGISPGTLSPVFSAGATGYTVNLRAILPNNVTNVRVTPTVNDPTAKLTVNGQDAASGQAQATPLPAPGSSTTIGIVVIAQNGTPKLYTVNVTRDALGGNNNLSALRVTAGGATQALNPAFTANTLNYTVGVGSGVASLAVTPTRQDPAATITVNGQATPSGQSATVNLSPAGEPTVIPVVVKAQNGSEKPYSIRVNRAALGGNNNLRSLTVSQGTLVPTFNANTTNYGVDVGNGVGSIVVTPTSDDPASTMTVNGSPATSGQAQTITLRNPGLSTTINITVRAPNGSPNTYIITVDRASTPPPSGNNFLSALAVSSGNLAPGFSTGITKYALTVDSSDDSVTVNATPQDSGANTSIFVNGEASLTNTVSLPPGLSTTAIEVIVKAPNGAEKSYFITATRPAPPEPQPEPPPAPASAPDLIPEDDSCLPDSRTTTGCADRTSREDNRTTVTRPRFRVASPLVPAGATPNLYVDGVKVKEGFDQGAETLTPPNDLTGNDDPGISHSIQSTVTNAAGVESPRSAVLTVIINTGGPAPPPIP